MYRNTIQLNSVAKERTNEESLMKHRKKGGWGEGGEGVGGGGEKRKKEVEKLRPAAVSTKIITMI